MKRWAVVGKKKFKDGIKKVRKCEVMGRKRWEEKWKAGDSPAKIGWKNKGARVRSSK